MPGGYLLDTNVVSETRKPRANAGVLEFLGAAVASDLFLSVLTLGELRKGVAGLRRTDAIGADRIAAWVDGLEANFSGRIVPVDASTARMWGELPAGRTLPVIDGLLAATAIRHGLILVTRNLRDVQRTGARLLNPWA